MVNILPDQPNFGKLHGEESASGTIPQVLQAKKKFFSLQNKTCVAAVILIPFILAIIGGGVYLSHSNNKMPIIAAVTPVPTSADSNSVSQSLKMQPISPTRSLSPTPLFPSGDPYAGWGHYTFGVLGLTIQYPPDWFVQVSSSSDGRSFHIYNKQPLSLYPYSAATDKAKYSLYIGDYKAGVSTLDQLEGILAKDYGATTYYYGSPAGVMVISRERIATYSGYTVFARDVSYTGLPGVITPQVYFLDGHGLAVKTQLELDVTNGVPYFDQILNTLKFTN